MINKIIINETQLKNIISNLILEQKVDINPKKLKIGDRGNDVVLLQQALINSGLLKISKPTGYFGNLTNKALIEYYNKSNPNVTANTNTKTATNTNKSYLLFDGKFLKFVSNGRIVREWNAWSGRTKWNATSDNERKLAEKLSKIEFMTFKDMGPIPEGAYTLGPIQARKNGNALNLNIKKDWYGIMKQYLDDWDKNGDRHAFNNGSIQDMIAWGNYRMAIIPKKGTNTFNRGSFYLHGGAVAGSIGCIDLVDKIDEFVKYYQGYLANNRATTIDLYVDYRKKINPNQLLPPYPQAPENKDMPIADKYDKYLGNQPWSAKKV